jgi:hypothetical protein
VNREKWKRHRVACDPAFHLSYLKNFVDTMVECTDDLFKILDKKLGKPCEVSELTSYFALQVLGTIMVETSYLDFRILGLSIFSYDFGALKENGENAEMMKHYYNFGDCNVFFFILKFESRLHI